DIDTRIRELTHDRHSLDDFAHAFFATPPALAGRASASGQPVLGPVTYTLADVVQTLKSIAPFDWEKYFKERLYGHGPGAPLDGRAGGGWKLVDHEWQSDSVRSREDQRKIVDFTYSLGFSVSQLSGQLMEVRWGGPAYEAGLAMGTFLIAVNGREYRSDRLR